VQQQHEDPRIGLVAVGFSPPGPLAEVAEHLDWRSRFLSDESRVCYEALGLARADLRHVYSPGTVAFYAKAILRGERMPSPVEDTRQLGGDGILRDGVLVRRWRPASPDDRVAPALLLGTAAELPEAPP
jgi:hypothetical protein